MKKSAGSLFFNIFMFFLVNCPWFAFPEFCLSAILSAIARRAKAEARQGDGESLVSSERRRMPYAPGLTSGKMRTRR